MTMLNCAGKLLNLSQPKIMGVINLAPDSFYADNRCLDVNHAVEKALQMIEEGASIIDVGGEATNPTNPALISDEEELSRVLPVVEALHKAVSIPISVDTSSPLVMRETVKAGAGLINDTRALRREGALEMAAQLHHIPVCLMHMRYMPEITKPPASSNTHPALIVEEVVYFLQQHITACLKAGIAKTRIIIDPGFGTGSFGKNTEENLYLLCHLAELKKLGYPILAGLSNKTFIGDLLKASSDKRLYGSITTAILAVLRGASIIRVHDVKATKDAIHILMAVEEMWNNNISEPMVSAAG